jgi:hypothetical protein
VLFLVWVRIVAKQVFLCCLGDVSDDPPTLGDVNSYGWVVKSILFGGKVIMYIKIWNQQRRKVGGGVFMVPCVDPF